eukprot:277851-Pleurochrysis_carterae.AAC.1
MRTPTNEWLPCLHATLARPHVRSCSIEDSHPPLFTSAVAAQSLFLSHPHHALATTSDSFPLLPPHA